MEYVALGRLGYAHGVVTREGPGDYRPLVAIDLWVQQHPAERAHITNFALWRPGTRTFEQDRDGVIDRLGRLEDYREEDERAVRARVPTEDDGADLREATRRSLRDVGKSLIVWVTTHELSV